MSTLARDLGNSDEIKIYRERPKGKAETLTTEESQGCTYLDWISKESTATPGTTNNIGRPSPFSYSNYRSSGQKESESPTVPMLGNSAELQHKRRMEAFRKGETVNRVLNMYEESPRTPERYQPD